MSFGGGGGASTGVNAHLHNSQTGEGAPLQFNGNITTGSAVQFNSTQEVPIEVLL
tara:strand:- start:139 stop:303 length:165 start_codon:yes stop_codon:yes gene_type:complete